MLVVLILLPALVGATEVRCGIMVHDVASLFGNTRIESGMDLNGEVLFGDKLIRPHVGLSLSMSGYTSKVYAGLALEHKIDWFLFNISVGGAVHSGKLTSDDMRKLGSRFLFRIAGLLGVVLDEQWSIGIMLDHISNAKILSEYNAGLDILGVWIGYRL